MRWARRRDWKVSRRENLWLRTDGLVITLYDKGPGRCGAFVSEREGGEGRFQKERHRLRDITAAKAAAFEMVWDYREGNW